MNLKNLVVTVAVATMTLPIVVQAGLTVSGNIGVAASNESDGTKTFGSRNSEVNVDAKETRGGITYFGHTEIDLDGTPTFDEARVGVEGGFGKVTIGDTDNACDALDIGVSPEVWFFHESHGQGGCRGNDDGNITYSRGMGPMTFAVSHNIKDGNEHSAIGAKVNLGRIALSSGYESLDNANNIALGGTIKVGKLTFGVNANLYDSDNNNQDATNVGVNFLYTAGTNNIYGGLAGGDQADSWSVGYKKQIGQTDLIAEAYEEDGDADTSYAIGMRHRF